MSQEQEEIINTNDTCTNDTESETESFYEESDDTESEYQPDREYDSDDSRCEDDDESTSEE